MRARTTVCFANSLVLRTSSDGVGAKLFASIFSKSRFIRLLLLLLKSCRFFGIEYKRSHLNARCWRALLSPPQNSYIVAVFHYKNKRARTTVCKANSLVLRTSSDLGHTARSHINMLAVGEPCCLHQKNSYIIAVFYYKNIRLEPLFALQTILHFVQNCDGVGAKLLASIFANGNFYTC